MNTVFRDGELDVVVVDDDEAIRDALVMVLEMEGLKVASYESGDAFLRDAVMLRPGCVLLDVHMPGRSGLDVLESLASVSFAPQVMMISGHGDIPMAVQAMRLGASDFIEKPFEATEVIARVRAILARGAQPPHSLIPEGRLPAFAGYDTLTPREIDVLEQIVAGASNKEAGRHLNISPRTVEVHRARIMEKLKARNTADLVRIVYRENVRPAGA